MSFDNYAHAKNEEMYATYISNTEKLIQKIYEIYKAACECTIEDFPVLALLYQDIEVLEIADTMRPDALGSSNGSIRRLLEEYMELYQEINPFCDNARIEHELENLRIQVGTCIDVMRHRNEYKLYSPYADSDACEWVN